MQRKIDRSPEKNTNAKRPKAARTADSHLLRNQPAPPPDQWRSDIRTATRGCDLVQSSPDQGADRRRTERHLHRNCLQLLRLHGSDIPEPISGLHLRPAQLDLPVRGNRPTAERVAMPSLR